MTSEQLFYDKKTGFDRLTEADRQGIQTYAEGYKTFLDESQDRTRRCEGDRTHGGEQRASAHGRATIRLKTGRQDLPHQPSQGHHARRDRREEPR